MRTAHKAVLATLWVAVVAAAGCILYSAYVIVGAASNVLEIFQGAING